MRFIPTTTSRVDALKKQAKARQRNGGGKYAALLDAVARTAGYEHWHHVTLCLRETEGVKADRSLAGTIAHIVRSEQDGQAVLVGTGSETSRTQPFLAFSTGIGDAWLLDPIRQQACCLVWRGQLQAPEIRELADRITIRWDGDYALRGAFFEVDTTHPEIGRRAIGGYPVDVLRDLLLASQPVEETIRQVIDQEDTVALTPSIVAQLVATGWKEAELQRAARQGARYSPARNSVLFPAMGGML